MKGWLHNVALDFASAADRWMHFHRFEYRSLCDFVDRLNGVPYLAVRSRRVDGSPSHTALAEMRSRQHHPSQVQS